VNSYIIESHNFQEIVVKKTMWLLPSNLKLRCVTALKHHLVPSS